MLHQPHHYIFHQETKVPQLSSSPHTNVADEAVSTGVDVRHGGAATTITSLDAGQGSGNINKTPSMPHDLPLPRGHTLGSDEGIMQQNELMDLKVKKLEKTVKTSQARRRSRVILSDNEAESGYSYKDAARKRREVVNVQSYTIRRRAVSTSSGEISTTEESVSTDGASMPVSTACTVQEVNKDKGKGIMKESEPEQIKTKLQQRQERAGYEAVVRLQEQLDEEERQRIARVHEDASSFNIKEWEDIQATIKAGEELAQRIQAEERKKNTLKLKKQDCLQNLSTIERDSLPKKRAEERRSKPLIQA
ncbi:hypothetical protein Tco_1404871 [Tanacetum coccineum]